ncbi:MAG: sulfopyruvate decarboxylase subunit alpha [Deltaproteobacteria bacterium]|nr:sulfopyruvate decarboxylase subunit alpha [Deltaproteobacteria bacterium]MBI3075595.1 sulfopyruvate decarboxylase subunit alpha [Deltaproteobacteria bacterium]
MVLTERAREHARALVRGLKAARIEVVASVPDQWIGLILEEVAKEGSFRSVPVAREEEGIGVCFGAVLGGKGAAMLMQNAGLLSSGTGLVTLHLLHQVPLLLLVSYRGTPGDPLFYHIPKGVRTEPALRALGIPYFLTDAGKDLTAQVCRTWTYARESAGPAALLLTADLFAGEDVYP